MATKPASPALWATDANYPMDAEPEEGTPTKASLGEEETVGWRPGKKPPAQKMNGWQNKVGQWTQWLDDGLVDFDQVVIDSTGDSNGDGAVESILNVIRTASAAIGADAAGYVGSGGTFNTTAGDIYNIGLMGNSNATRSSGAFDLTNVGVFATASGGQVNKALVASGDSELDGDVTITGTLYRTTATGMKIPASASQQLGSAHTRTAGHWLVAASAVQIVYPIMVPEGAVITSWQLYIDKTSAGTAHARIYSQHDDANTETAEGVDQTITTTPGETLFSENPNLDVHAQRSYFIVFTPTGAANDLLGHAVVYWTMPPP